MRQLATTENLMATTETLESVEGDLNESAISTGGENSQDSQEEVENSITIDDEQKEKLLRLPLGRIKAIIKSDPDVHMINQEAIFLIGKSTEIFIDALAKEAYNYTAEAKKKTVQKRDILSAIVNVDALSFLDGTLD